ncbi:MAG: tyrosine--tRNA ligase [Alphaproteobacteria bacterium]|nr:tyrosine--tRNA ligase [Alphaproteobacteria bacterium]
MHSFISEFKDRGFFYQCTDENALSKALSTKNPSAYIGFDCTATSLHVGSLMQLMILRLLQKNGIRPIVLLGGATTKIGDPTGKDKSRQMLTNEQIAENAKGIKKSISKFVKFGDKPSDAMLLDNSKWLDSIKYTAFLRDYGQHFSINRMLSFESVKSRLDREQNLSFLEFNYMILQAYDFYYLNKTYNCILQCGGADQWGNIVNGVELIRRLLKKESFGITSPLITTASGAKMGKTEKGAIWLNEDMLSPYEYYQFWRNSDDKDVFKFMKIFTDISAEEINKYESDDKKNINNYKKLLALEATKLCHGEKEANKASETATAVFEKGNMENLATYELDKKLAEQGIYAYEIFKLCGLSESNGKAKRLIKGSGASLNKKKITDENLKIFTQDFKSGYITLSSGKKNHIKVVLK